MLILCEFMFRLYFANHVQTQTLFYPHKFRSKEDSGCRTRMSAHSYRSFAIAIRKLNFPRLAKIKTLSIFELSLSFGYSTTEIGKNCDESTKIKKSIKYIKIFKMNDMQTSPLFCHNGSDPSIHLCVITLLLTLIRRRKTESGNIIK
jgi:hypothetical protein